MRSMKMAKLRFEEVWKDTKKYAKSRKKYALPDMKITEFSWIEKIDI